MGGFLDFNRVLAASDLRRYLCLIFGSWPGMTKDRCETSFSLAVQIVGSRCCGSETNARGSPL